MSDSCAYKAWGGNPVWVWRRAPDWRAAMVAFDIPTPKAEALEGMGWLDIGTSSCLPSGISP